MEPSNVLAWDNLITEFNKACRSLGLLSHCACLWGDNCKKAQVIFALTCENGAYDLCGVMCIKLKLAGTSEKKSRWRSVVLKNLGLKEELKNLYRVPVAPHHWTTAQLKYLQENNAKQLTTVLSKEEVDRIGHFTDRLGTYKDENGETKYFILPNYPREHWVIHAKALFGDGINQADHCAKSAMKGKKKKKKKEWKIQIEEEKNKKRQSHELDKWKKTWEWKRKKVI
jgi:hypothetical protein